MKISITFKTPQFALQHLLAFQKFDFCGNKLPTSLTSDYVVTVEVTQMAFAVWLLGMYSEMMLAKDESIISVELLPI